MKLVNLTVLVLAGTGMASHGQVPKSGVASAVGPCSVAHSGNGDTIFLQNCGIGKEQGDKIIALLRSILGTGTLQQINGKLDHLLSVSAQPLQVQANSGGINVEQGTTGANSPIVDSPITIGELRKAISPGDLPKVAGLLASAPAKPPIVVGADQYSGAYSFPSDFRDALEGSGWPMDTPGLASGLTFSAARKGTRGPQLLSLVNLRRK